MTEPANQPPAGFRDRSARLVLLGAVAIGAGLLCELLALLHLLLLGARGRLPGAETLPADPLAYVMGALVYALIGAAFVWVGFGSVRRRRWVRSLMLTLAWTWLLSGAAMVLLLPVMIDAAFDTSPTAAFAPEEIRVAKAVFLVAVAAFGIALPGLFVWVYRDPDVARTCEAHDPRPCWTERCPAPVLGLSVALGACGVLFAPMALRPAVPVFGWLATGLAGAVLMLGCAGWCLYLAVELYRLRPSAWWGTTTLLVLLGVSTLLTTLRADPVELYRAIGYPRAELVAPGRLAAGGLAVVALTIGVTLVSLVYMLRIRKYFDDSGGRFQNE